MGVLQHLDVGTSLTRTEWEQASTHEFASQATGDIAYAAAATGGLTALAIGATNTIMSVVGGIPAWGATIYPTTVIVGHTVAEGGMGKDNLTPGVQIHGVTGNLSALSIWGWGNNVPGTIILGSSDSGTVGTHSALDSTEALGMIQFAADDGGDLVQSGATIKAVADGSQSSNNVPAALVIMTNPGSTTDPAEVARWDKTGHYLAANAAGPALYNEAADWDNPTLIPNKADPDTGIGWASANNMTLAAGGAGLVWVNGATGSLGFGVAASANYKHRFGGSFTAAADPRGFFVGVALTAPAGSSAIRQMYLSGSLTTQTASETLSRAAALEIEALDLTIGSGSNVTTATTVYIGGAPTEGGTNNYALFVDAGLNRFDGDGTRVFELPADATDPTSGGGAAVGQIPVKIGGVTKHIAYY